jgi:type III pantothenate kinase
VEIRDPGCVIGKDTVRAMQSGIYWGSIDMIEGLINRIRAEYGQPMKAIATGGVASLFEGATESIDHFDSDLTIRGLLEIYRRNTISET